MTAIATENIRNVALIGHTGSGKTSLAEAMLHKAGATTRLGSVNDGTSVLDFTDEEKEKRSSYYSATCYLTHAGTHLNIIDTPGSGDFCGQAIAALAPVETALVAISAADGIGVNTRRMLQRAREFGLATMIVVSRIDADTARPAELVGQIQESFGSDCVPVNLPANNAQAVVDCLPKGDGTPDFGDLEDAYTAAIEAVVGADDDLMEKYLGGETTDDEILRFAPKAVAEGAITPILRELTDRGRHRRAARQARQLRPQSGTRQTADAGGRRGRSRTRSFRHGLRRAGLQGDDRRQEQH